MTRMKKIGAGIFLTILIINFIITYIATIEMTRAKNELDRMYATQKNTAAQLSVTKQQLQELKKPTPQPTQTTTPIPTKTPRPKPISAIEEGGRYYAIHNPVPHQQRGRQIMKPIRVDNSYEAAMAQSREMLRQYQAGEVTPVATIKPYEDLRDAGDKNNHH